MIWLLFSCQEDVTQIPVTCNDIITYETVGAPFLRSYCTGCHSSNLPRGLRYGAPDSINLDTYEDAKQHAIRSYVRSVHFEDMPPSGGITQQEKQRFMQWALCGAKGEPLSTPYVEVEKRGTSRKVFTTIVNGEDNTFVIQRFIEDDPIVHPDDTLMREEIYQFDDGKASFQGYDEWDTNGVWISSVRYEPNLPLHPEEWTGGLF